MRASQLAGGYRIFPAGSGWQVTTELPERSSSGKTHLMQEKEKNQEEKDVRGDNKSVGGLLQEETVGSKQEKKGRKAKDNPK